MVMPSFGGVSVRQVAIGVMSGLMVLAALFVAGPERTPGFARAIIWEDEYGSPVPAARVEATGARSEPGGAAAEEAAPAASQWPGLLARLKPPVAPAPGPQPAVPAPSPQPTAAPTPSPKLNPLPSWVLSSGTATLWERPDAQSPQLLSVPDKSYLRVLGQPENNRLPVYYDDGKPNGRKAGAWIDLGKMWSPTAQPRVVASSRGGARPNPDISSPAMFIAAVAEAAQESQRDSQVPASVTVAQAILESDWGKSLLAIKGNNYFGIKASSGPGPAGVISMNTWEVLGGRDVVVKDGFKAYNNLYESIMEHGRFLLANSRYAPAFKAVKDPQEFARRIHAAGYATDPAYSTKLINLMNKYNLYQYDLP